jgi:hypothetical protein
MDADAGLERPGTDEAWRRDLQQRVQEQIVHFRRGHRYWSAGYHAALYGAPISAFVTTLSALTRYSSTTSKVAAAVTTVLSVLAAQGRFQDKWRANRSARDQMQQLDADLINPNSDLSSLTDQYKKILETEDTAILGPQGSGA